MKPSLVCEHKEHLATIFRVNNRNASFTLQSNPPEIYFSSTFSGTLQKCLIRSVLSISNLYCIVSMKHTGVLDEYSKGNDVLME